MFRRKVMAKGEDMKIGDKVRGKVGGPDMTVVDIEESDSGVFTIHCVWYEKDKEQQGEFQAEKLILI
jgi:uncharacterized protein YodC (DUF2158 family)